jgi:hypothetical protein
MPDSSWIADIRSSADGAEMTLHNGSKYLIYGVSDYTLQQWKDSSSLGKFYNQNLKHLMTDNIS